MLLCGFLLLLLLDGLRRLSLHHRLFDDRLRRCDRNRLRLRSCWRWLLRRPLDELLRVVRQLHVREAHLHNEVAVLEITVQWIKPRNLRRHDQRLACDVALFALASTREHALGARLAEAFDLYFADGF